LITASGASAGPSTWMRHRSGAIGQPACKTLAGRAIACGNDQAREPAERRIAGALARIDLAGIKCLAVVGDRAFITGCSG